MLDKPSHLPANPWLNTLNQTLTKLALLATLVGSNCKQSMVRMQNW